MSAIPYRSGQVWMPANPTKPGRRVSFSTDNPPSEAMRRLIGRHRQVAFCVIERDGTIRQGKDMLHEDSGFVWHSRVQIESFQQWIRKAKAVLAHLD